MKVVMVMAWGPWQRAATSIIRDLAMWYPMSLCPSYDTVLELLTHPFLHETVNSPTAGCIYSSLCYKLPQILSGARQILKIQMRCTYILNLKMFSEYMHVIQN